MVDEITIDGTRFVAARQAAALVGMSPDYLTRWCREGLVTARRLTGGIWFVNRNSRRTLARYVYGELLAIVLMMLLTAALIVVPIVTRLVQKRRVGAQREALPERE
jgi:hypothetical protein